MDQIQIMEQQANCLQEGPGSRKRTSTSSNLGDPPFINIDAINLGKHRCKVLDLQFDIELLNDAASKAGETTAVKN